MAIPPVPWAEIDTVLLDMDGTLLDLHFDNHFWLYHVPEQIARRDHIDRETALAWLRGEYQKVAGRLEWYCVDHWSRELSLPIAELKEEMSHHIRPLPHAFDFLRAMGAAGKRRVLVTNAHTKSLALKLRITGLGALLDEIVVSHDLGAPKEDARFWARLRGVLPFDPARALFVDDSVAVLAAARAAGIGCVVAVTRPDSHGPERAVADFAAVVSLAELLPA
ncbi:MAG: haloacid dehalogenase [Nitrospirae bacterium CG18_big_fil_WC_8_21_14_2_50_70_55]|nr:GMP/IMP nucleotidase [Deltaproteobacteria bacterium]PIQ07116.1 MAG: haloacid dehalogenase [Nitrospirae bacterium CG18_big_fil_WC_8_21_14_2_50_70_55]PIU77396.1 MAG: haloacid dehalogenase [Nitrospirae bacterium CG06_land_8_20_14_3_00_70_43]PIW81985.1 MAG: haloacid dehalogenase [Nitrospirae bacterium CG_4_8_14_3_um_filter_70_85]PIX83303.1 MAG: haloacid dehalogenase [Nitrospirae bacterium CG_4_10_14_3_um_filter_70_108]PJB96439.1 MAG: haloacid dehalogenase [Nitrospirae bacterium CG_4_9_14_0_8_um